MGEIVADITTLVEIGQIFSNISLGYLSDKVKSRAIFIPIMMSLLSFDFFLISMLKGDDTY